MSSDSAGKDQLTAADAAFLLESAEELYEDAPCGYISTLPDGTIVKVNRTFERWTGHERGALLGQRRFQDLLAPGGRIYHETHLRPLLQMQDFVREIALEIECADRRRLPVLINSTLLRDGEGCPRVVRTTIFDATDRRTYEQELLRARRRAERLQRHNEMLAEVGRVLAPHQDVVGRAVALLELLVGDHAGGGLVQLAGEQTACAAAGRADEPDLHAVLRDALDGRHALREEIGPRYVGMPLCVHGEILGALALAARTDSKGYEPDELRLLSAVADRAAVALESARLYERDREVASTLQRSMMAGRLPEDPRCVIGTYYSPAVGTLEVGGDWYDAFEIAPGRIALVVGDVVGKGLEAAATMGQLRSALRALAISGVGPRLVLENLDRVVEQTRAGVGATVAIAEIDLASGSMLLACAGHPPPILLPASGPATLVWQGRSMPLGADVLGTGRSEAGLRLERGTRGMFYSDGAVERRDRPIDRGIERLMSAFTRRRYEPIGTVSTSLSTELLPEQHGADDVCLLAFAFAG